MVFDEKWRQLCNLSFVFLEVILREGLLLRFRSEVVIWRAEEGNIYFLSSLGGIDYFEIGIGIIEWMFITSRQSHSYRCCPPLARQIHSNFVSYSFPVCLLPSGNPQSIVEWRGSSTAILNP